jgi:hypothetical protein
VQSVAGKHLSPYQRASSYTFSQKTYKNSEPYQFEEPEDIENNPNHANNELNGNGTTQRIDIFNLLALDPA